MKPDRPDPLVPADTDIDGLGCFLLNVNRLFASELWALSSGEEFKAAVALWGKAWLQSPPGSLPNDDRLLAAFSGAGPRWKKIKAMALRGFVECNDGRLYNKTLCEDVLRAAKKKQEHRLRTAKASASRWPKPPVTEAPPVAGDPPQDIRDDPPKVSVTESVTESVTDRMHESVTSPQYRERTVQGQEREKEPAARPLSAGGAELDFNQIEHACRMALGDKAPADLVIGPMVALLRAGHPLQRVTDYLRSEARRERRRPILTWKLWAELYGRDAAGAAAVPTAAPSKPFAMDDERWGNLLFAYRKTGVWPQNDKIGPAPGEPGCKVPPHLLEAAA